MKKARKFNPNRRLVWTVTALFFVCLTACDNDTPWMMGDIPENGQTSGYSNKLSAPAGGNELILQYNGNPVIGKEVKFGRDKAGQGTLTLCGILPGHPEYTLKQISLTPAGTGYTFEGRTAGNSGMPFRYKGKIEAKKLTLSLSEVTIPGNLLTGK